MALQTKHTQVARSVNFNHPLLNLPTTPKPPKPPKHPTLLMSPEMDKPLTYKERRTLWIASWNPEPGVFPAPTDVGRKVVGVFTNPFFETYE